MLFCLAHTENAGCSRFGERFKVLMYICSEVISTTVTMRNAVQISGLLHVNFSPSVCLCFESLHYHSGTVCEMKVEKGSRLA